MRVLIVDDHPLFIKGVQALLTELAPDIETLGARTLQEAASLASSTPLDLVLLDLKLPGVENLDALVTMRAKVDSPIVVVSGNDQAEFIWSAIKLGAAGYIPKDTEQSLMIQALRVVLARGVYIPPHALRSGVTAPLRDTAAVESGPRLSERQLSVLQRVLQAKSNKLIARELNIAEGTVKAHLWAIYQVLGVSTRLQAMAKAHELRLVDLFSSRGDSPT